MHISMMYNLFPLINDLLYRYDYVWYIILHNSKGIWGQSGWWAIIQSFTFDEVYMWLNGPRQAFAGRALPDICENQSDNLTDLFYSTLAWTPEHSDISHTQIFAMHECLSWPSSDILKVKDSS